MIKITESNIKMHVGDKTYVGKESIIYFEGLDHGIKIAENCARKIIDFEIKRLRGLYKTSAFVKPSIVIKILRDVQNKIDVKDQINKLTDN